MNQTPHPRPARQLDALDFEFTDFDDARRALDELPEGVQRLSNGGADPWERRRRPLGAADKALTGHALDWLMQLPAALRPQRLCAGYPRVANRLAAAWPDRRAAAVALDELLRDRRGGRRGFPEAMRAELVALRALLEGESTPR